VRFTGPSTWWNRNTKDEEEGNQNENPGENRTKKQMKNREGDQGGPRRAEKSDPTRAKKKNKKKEDEGWMDGRVGSCGSTRLSP